MPDDTQFYQYIGCGAIFVQMELMMYVFEKNVIEQKLIAAPAPFDWKAVQEYKDYLQRVTYEGQ